MTSNDRGYKGHGLNHLDQEVDGSMVRINGLFHLLTNGEYLSL